MFIDVNGDSVQYANSEIEAFVQQYSSQTKINRRGKEVKNKKYNAQFAQLISSLEASSDMFVFSNDASALKSSDLGAVGEFNVESDGSQFNIIVPNFSGGEKGALMDLMGGRGAVLAEEVFHANQYLTGDISKIKQKGSFALKSSNPGNTNLWLEVDAKMFAASSGMANLSSSTYMPGFSIPTMAGLVNRRGNDRIEVGRLLVLGTREIVSSTSTPGLQRTVVYPKSYNAFK